MKFNLTESQRQIKAIKESLVAQFSQELSSFSGQPSAKLGEALNKIATKFGDTVTFEAFKQALNISESGAALPFTGADKAEIKKAVDSGSSPDAVVALVKQKANEKDPSKKAALDKLEEDTTIDTDVAEVVDQDDLLYCDWCGDEFEPADLHMTDLGNLCDQCIAAIKSRGEDIWVKQ